MKNLTGKVALITGGSKGIGYAIAKSLLAEGMKVAITSRSQEGADKAAGKLNNSFKGNALGIVADVRNYESQQQVVEKIIAEWGQLDVVIDGDGRVLWYRCVPANSAYRRAQSKLSSLLQ